MMLGQLRSVVALGLAVACAEPGLEVPAAPSALRVSVTPVDAAGRVRPTFRAQVEQAAGAEAWLFAGEISSSQERAIVRGELSSALRARAVPLFYWAEGEDLWVQPLRWLEPGQSYALALIGRGVASRFQVSEEEVARAELRFPTTLSAGAAAAHCGAGLVAPETIALSPNGALEVSVVAGEGAAPCVVWRAAAALPAPAVLPPEVGGVLLAPVLFGAGEPTEVSRGEADSTECSGRLLHGHCVEALDDRVLVTALAEDALWLLQEPARRLVLAPAGRRVALTRGLEPASRARLRGSLLLSGKAEAIDLQLTLADPALHLVITEVLANPVGAEPASEWVELFNDSAAPAPLGGTWLTDGSGRAPLPPVTLAPGELALLVPPGFAPSADVAPAPGTRLLELSALGARGLSNSGEPLLLFGEVGVLARFPAVPAPKAGRSIARVHLDTHDDDPRAFAEHRDPGASPGAPHWAD